MRLKKYLFYLIFVFVLSGGLQISAQSEKGCVTDDKKSAKEAVTEKNDDFAPIGFRKVDGPKSTLIPAFTVRRNDRAAEAINAPGNVENLKLSKTEINRDGSNNAKSLNEIEVFTEAVDPESDPLTYQYTVSCGKIVGQGEKVIWDLSDAAPGTYTITAAVDDGCGFCGRTVTKEVKVSDGSDSPSLQPETAVCPSVKVIFAKREVKDGEIFTFTATAEFSGGKAPAAKLFYDWMISSGEIISGQNTPVLTVRAKKAEEVGTLTAVVEVSDRITNCENGASETVGIIP